MMYLFWLFLLLWLQAPVPRPGTGDIPLGLDPKLPWPKQGHAVREIKLGERLFFDPVLSGRQDISCSSCHLPGQYFSDGKPVSVGSSGRLGRRNSPSLFNVAYRRTLFWDGRALSLEDQVLQPLTNPQEMDNSIAVIEQRLNQHPEYRQLFEGIFGKPRVTLDQVARVLAAYQRSLLSGDSDFDRFWRKGNKEALSQAARRGFGLFTGKARCSICHNGPLFSDGDFHNTGVSWKDGSADRGRYEITGKEKDLGKFLVPSLRNVAETAPYMHDGSLDSLVDVIEFYDQGGGRNPYLDSRVKPLGLSQSEKADLVEFLESLTGRTEVAPKSERQP